VDFQNAAELVPDGIVGPLTHAALDARQGPGPSPPVPPTPSGALTPEQEPPHSPSRPPMTSSRYG
jgi:hypothetical protein